MNNNNNQQINWTSSKLKTFSFPTPGDLPNPGIKLASPTSPALAGGFLTVEPSGKPTTYCQEYCQSPGLSRV